MINNITGRKKRPKTVVSAESIENRKQKIAALFQNILNAVCDCDTTVFTIPHNLTQSLASSYDCDPITPFEVRSALQGTRADAAPGPDAIPARILKLNPLCQPLCLVLNASCRLGGQAFQGVPAEWKKSEIVAIPKKGNSTSLDNQRGISLMSTTAKLLNRILLNRLMPQLNPIILQLQSGFRPKRSTIEQIITLRTIIDDCRTRQRAVSVVFGDFKKHSIP
jgi:hypothetical protein